MRRRDRQQPRDSKKYLTIKETAALLRVSRETIEAWIHKGALEHIRVGRIYRIPRDAIEALRKK